VNFKYSEKEYIDKHERYMVGMPGHAPVVMVEAEGSIVKDINGKEYIDGYSQVAGPTGIGNRHPKVVAAVKEQVDKLPCNSPWFINIPQVELAEKLAKITPGNLRKFYFLVGGGEAVEYGIRTAIKASGKGEVLGVYFGYHGTMMSSLSLGNSSHRRGLPPMPGFRQIPPAYCYRCFYGQRYPGCNFECAKALETTIQYATYNDVAAFVIEPMMGVAGHIIPPKDYFKIVREICDKYGVFLIFDEIQTGFGRTGKMWGADYYEVQPDIMILGKALGGGIPISAAVFRDDIDLPSEEEQEVFSTHSGSPLCCAAACAAVDVVLEEKLPEKAAETGKFMMGRLEEIQKDHPLIGEVRGAGLFLGIELVKNRKTKERAPEEALRLIQECRNRGVLLQLAMKPHVGNAVTIKPPMNIPKDLTLRILDVLDESLHEVEKSLTD